MDFPRDLPEGWEKKALIVVVIIVFIITAYALNPFQSKANVTSNNQSSPTAPTIVPLPQSNPNNSSNISSNSSNNTGVPSQITADQAKNIAEQSNPGYSAGQPSQGTVLVNNTTIAVWIVPITKTGSSKTLYIDITSGRIVKTT